VKKFLFIVILISILDVLKAQVETTVKVDTAPEKSKSNIYVNVDKMAEFPGGVDSLKLFYKKNSKYKTCNDSDNCKAIYYSIVVDSLGFPGKFKIIQGINNKYDKEVERLVKSMPRWEPALKNGKVVNALVTLGVGFKKE
jgi:protein TonB